jgi:fumarylacetoacetase
VMRHHLRDSPVGVPEATARQTACNLRPGDVLGTGTQSGPQAAEAGSLLELSVGGKQPLTLPNGETRRFLEDDDAVIMRGWCERAGAARVGFGEVEGRVLKHAA